MQDAHSPIGPACPNGYSASCTAEWRYNEIVLDRYRMPWEGELHQIIEAVIAHPHASLKARRYADAVHAALLRRMGIVDEAKLPLLHYDPSRTRSPFSSPRSPPRS